MNWSSSSSSESKKNPIFNHSILNLCFVFSFFFFTFFTRKNRILSIILLLLLLFLSWKWWLWWKWLAIDNNDEKIFFHRCCRCFELKKKKFEVPTRNWKPYTHCVINNIVVQLFDQGRRGKVREKNDLIQNRCQGLFDYHIPVCVCVFGSIQVIYVCMGFKKHLYFFSISSINYDDY